MKMIRLLSISYFAFIVVGCNTTSSPIVELSERIKNLSYDTTIMHTSLDGFRIQISPRMAQQIAKERGYSIDSFFSSVTFEDIIEAGFKERRVQEIISLKRYDGDEDCYYEIMLNFDYGKVESVQLKHKFEYQRQRAEEMF